MTQRDRDRLMVLKKAQKKLITQKQAASELDMTERHVRRLLKQLKARGDSAVIHALRGRPSNRKLGKEDRQKTVAVLSQPVSGLWSKRWRTNTWPADTRFGSGGKRR
ncbi:MAG: helix-turn-helix domain-containing protein [Bryobacteraceae bacterium]